MEEKDFNQRQKEYIEKEFSFTFLKSKDKQIAFLITQHADFNSKIRAIQEYNKLKQRIIDKKELSGEVNIKNSGLKEEAKEKGFEDIRDYLQSVMNDDNNT